MDLTRPPVDILDTAPIYSSIAVDTEHNEVMLQDANMWSIRVFSRLTTPLGIRPTEISCVIGNGLMFSSIVAFGSIRERGYLFC